jgi:hypothetical protein
VEGLVGLNDECNAHVMINVIISFLYHDITPEVKG